MPVADSSDMVVDSSYGAQEGKSPSGGCSTEATVPVSLSSPAADILKNFYHTKRVGNYLIGRKLGEGSFAKVREGLHALTGEKVRRIHSTSKSDTATLGPASWHNTTLFLAASLIHGWKHTCASTLIEVLRRSRVSCVTFISGETVL